MNPDFHIRRCTEAWDYERGEYTLTDNWEVSLPHQCDDWVVAGEKYAEGVPHAEAVRQLESFIAAAQHTLFRLNARQADR